MPRETDSAFERWCVERAMSGFASRNIGATVRIQTTFGCERKKREARRKTSPYN